MKASVELEEATTAVPADCPSDLETETTSKKSKAKRSDRRGPKRQAERARFHMCKRGRDVSGLTDEEVVALRDKVFAEERGTLDLASSQETSLEIDLMAKFFAELGALSVNSKYKSTEADRQAVHKYALKASRVYDKTWLKCQLCCGDKWADEKHLMSTSHLARVEEECYLNSVLGPSQNGRRFGPDGLYGCRTLSRSSMKLYWGCHIENMVSFARQRFQEGTMISYKYSKNRPAALVQGKHVKGVSLSVISYLASQGKYQVDKNQLFDWYLLPDEAPEEEEEEEEDGQTLGWWPVLQIELDPASGFEPTTVVVIIVCVYQLFDAVPPAWPYERPSSGASSSAA